LFLNGHEALCYRGERGPTHMCWLVVGSVPELDHSFEEDWPTGQ